MRLSTGILHVGNAGTLVRIRIEVRSKDTLHVFPYDCNDPRVH